ncbi:hypothetical protein ACHHYP_01261 [Achlya hypogyna]|uniref:Tubby C-terminal domain-containing protein n=1 Tax=Achlya hypogyna TaxID=1202772 RepID=A0A1V9Z9A3_ACHHY|nr:hypothetical protein ACHHYP_01261 [Achlya hypogyna]
MLGTTDGAAYACRPEEGDAITIDYLATFGQTPRRMHVAIADVALHNKQPMWMASRQAFCLDFQGRVRVASVKNFVLSVHGRDTAMVFGRTHERHSYVLDYGPPLAAVHAFAIALSSLDTKCFAVS